jgi:excisionase family DNA binding protein
VATRAKTCTLPADSPFLMRHEAARFARVHVSHIDAAIKNESLRAYRPAGRKVLILREDLMKWITAAPVWEGVQRG